MTHRRPILARQLAAVALCAAAAGCVTQTERDRFGYSTDDVLLRIDDLTGDTRAQAETLRAAYRDAVRARDAKAMRGALDALARLEGLK